MASINTGKVSDGSLLGLRLHLIRSLSLAVLTHQHFRHSIENSLTRVLSSPLATQPSRLQTQKLTDHAGTHSGWRKRHTAASVNGLHAKTDRSHLQSPFSALPNRHAQARGHYGHHAVALLSARED